MYSSLEKTKPKSDILFPHPLQKKDILFPDKAGFRTALAATHPVTYCTI